MGSAAITLGCVLICLHCRLSSGALLKPVTNVKWKSFNFFTSLEWEETTENATYTVRVSGIKSNWIKKPECTQIQTTRCDLTNVLQNVSDTYTAEVLSYPPGDTEENEDPPVAKSPPIQLLKDTMIGQPSFTVTRNSTSEIQLKIDDPYTYIRFLNHTRKTLRDIYGSGLEYKVFYWKDGTSGKKIKIAKEQVILMDVDPGFSYCFSIQPHITSPYKKGQESEGKCSSSEDRSPFEDIGTGAYALMALGVLLLIVVVIGITVCMCRRKTPHTLAEANPLTA
ncbi:tissue factor [Amblyraja radiata]|uniref:tissue factor n=1 Tax=Amblyraja radiata TaxID=386614 RepID=UPI0014037B85|nr:tissue factor [Amblyraja radiata]